MVITAFFIPAYQSISAFRFLIMAIGTIGNDSEITLIDLLVILLPLLLIPATALLILIKAINKKPLNSLLLRLPFFSITFFFLILSLDMTRQVASNNVFDLLTKLSVGFYLAAFASLLLVFSFSRRESLNMGSGRR